MDSIDRRILTTIQTDGRISIKKLAEACFISPPAASVRLQNLEKSGMITKFVAAVDYQRLGFFIKAFVRVAVNARDKADFYAYVASHSHIIECDCITGDYSMQLKVVFELMTDLDEFINDLQQFGDTNTNIVFSTNVEMRPLPLDEADDDD